jgi:hypothetical protein
VRPTSSLYASTGRRGFPCLSGGVKQPLSDAESRPLSVPHSSSGAFLRTPSLSARRCSLIRVLGRRTARLALPGPPVRAAKSHAHPPAWAGTAPSSKRQRPWPGSRVSRASRGGPPGANRQVAAPASTGPGPGPQATGRCWQGLIWDLTGHKPEVEAEDPIASEPEASGPAGRTECQETSLSANSTLNSARRPAPMAAQ